MSIETRQVFVQAATPTYTQSAFLISSCMRFLSVEKFLLSLHWNVMRLLNSIARRIISHICKEKKSESNWTIRANKKKTTCFRYWQEPLVIINAARKCFANRIFLHRDCPTIQWVCQSWDMHFSKCI